MTDSTPPSAVAGLQIDGLTKSFFGLRVLHGVSFEAPAGEVVGLVGENGSGKSTTMNIVAGVLRADEGTMKLAGRPHAPANRREAEAAGIAFIQQELSIFPNLSVAENLLLGRAPRAVPGLPFISRSQRTAWAAAILEKVGLRIDPRISASRLSSGERQLLEIARALSLESRVMIFDEPTTSLTAPEAERLFALIRRIKAQGTAVIFISHTLEDVLRLSDRIVVMRDGIVTLCERRAEMTSQHLIQAMLGRPVSALFPPREQPAFTIPIAGDPVIKLERVSEPGIVKDITLEVLPGEIVGISGLMGSGRSELARIIFGLDPHHGGEIKAAGVRLRANDLSARLAAGIAFLTEDRRADSLLANASVADNIGLGALPLYARRGDGRLRTGALARAIDEVAGLLRIKSADRTSTPVRALSGGNQQKVILGRWLLRRPRLLILDEPTRGIDLGAKEEIYRLLAKSVSAGMGILVISSEIEELLGLCDRILVMHQGRLVAEFTRSKFDRQAILAAAFGQAIAS